MAGSGTQRDVSAGPADEFGVGDRRIIVVDEREIGVFRLPDGFVAYENLCCHQGGPVCTGRIFPRLTTHVDEGGRVLQERYDQSRPQLVCPWHGWEYDLHTGIAVGDPSASLNRFDVRVESGEVLVAV